MDVEQLRMVLRDMYQTDIYRMPYWGKWKAYFKEASYAEWALNELEVFLIGKMLPNKKLSVDELLSMVEEFRVKMQSYQRLNSNTRDIFHVAELVAENTADLFIAMR